MSEQLEIQESATPIAELEKLCDKYDLASDNIRAALWEILKTPITPAFLVAATISLGAKAGLLPKEVAILSLSADFLWLMLKCHNAYETIARVRLQQWCIRDNIRGAIQNTQEENQLLLQAFLDKNITGKRISDNVL